MVGRLHLLLHPTHVNPRVHGPRFDKPMDESVGVDPQQQNHQLEASAHRRESQEGKGDETIAILQAVGEPKSHVRNHIHSSGLVIRKNKKNQSKNHVTGNLIKKNVKRNSHLKSKSYLYEHPVGDWCRLCHRAPYLQ